MDKINQINENKFIYTICKSLYDMNVFIRDRIIQRQHLNFAKFFSILISFLLFLYNQYFIFIPILFFSYLVFVKLNTVKYYTYQFKFFGLLTGYEFKNTYKQMRFKDKLLIKDSIVYYFESNLTLQELQKESQKISSALNMNVVDISHYHKNNNIFVITAKK